MMPMPAHESPPQDSHYFMPALRLERYSAADDDTLHARVLFHAPEASDMLYLRAMLALMRGAAPPAALF